MASLAQGPQPVPNSTRRSKIPRRTKASKYNGQIVFDFDADMQTAPENRSRKSPLGRERPSLSGYTCSKCSSHTCSHRVSPTLNASTGQSSSNVDLYANFGKAESRTPVVRPKKRQGQLNTLPPQKRVRHAASHNDDHKDNDSCNDSILQELDRMQNAAEDDATAHFQDINDCPDMFYGWKPGNFARWQIPAIPAQHAMTPRDKARAEAWKSTLPAQFIRLDNDLLPLQQYPPESDDLSTLFQDVNIHGLGQLKADFSSNCARETGFTQPVTRQLTQYKLLRDVKAIYKELAAVELQCMRLCHIHHIAGQDISNENWSHFTSTLQDLFDLHHRFYQQCQVPEASKALRILALKFSMPQRIWKSACEDVFRLLYERDPASIADMVEYVSESVMFFEDFQQKVRELRGSIPTKYHRALWGFKRELLLIQIDGVPTDGTTNEFNNEVYERLWQLYCDADSTLDDAFYRSDETEPEALELSLRHTTASHALAGWLHFGQGICGPSFDLYVKISKILSLTSQTSKRCKLAKIWPGWSEVFFPLVRHGRVHVVTVPYDTSMRSADPRLFAPSTNADGFLLDEYHPKHRERSSSRHRYRDSSPLARIGSSPSFPRNVISISHSDNPAIVDGRGRKNQSKHKFNRKKEDWTQLQVARRREREERSFERQLEMPRDQHSPERRQRKQMYSNQDAAGKGFTVFLDKPIALDETVSASEANLASHNEEW